MLLSWENLKQRKKKTKYGGGAAPLCIHTLAHLECGRHQGIIQVDVCLFDKPTWDNSVGCLSYIRIAWLVGLDLLLWCVNWAHFIFICLHCNVVFAGGLVLSHEKIPWTAALFSFFSSGFGHFLFYFILFSKLGVGHQCPRPVWITEQSELQYMYCTVHSMTRMTLKAHIMPFNCGTDS